jgi:hypothetical protein
MRRFLLTLAALAALAPLATPALADDDTKPKGDKDEARALVQTGVALLNKKDYRGALAVFKDAYTKYRSAKILLNIGTTLKALGRDAEAANTYQAYLDAPDTDPARDKEITGILGELDGKLARVALAVTPVDAEVQLNLGEWVVASELTLVRIAPGSFQLKARKEGFAPAERRGDAVAGVQTDVAINLLEEPPEEDLDVVDDSGAGTGAVGDGKLGVVAPYDGPRPRSRLGAAVGAHLDPKNKGAAATVGIVVGVVERVQVEATALLGPNQGAYLGTTLYLLTGTWRPTIAIGAPVFFSDGARVSGRGAAGLEIVASRHLSLVAEVGVERAFNPEPDIDEWSVIPSVALHGRL